MSWYKICSKVHEIREILHGLVNQHKNILRRRKIKIPDEKLQFIIKHHHQPILLPVPFLEHSGDEKS